MSTGDLSASRVVVFRASQTVDPAAPPVRASALLGEQRSTGPQLGLVALFSLTSFVGAALLFTVQPMIAKVVLPLFGGSPSVWNTSNLFFQVTLLAGYLGAHLAVRRFGVRRQSLLHLALVGLPLLALPIGLPAAAGTPDGVSHVLWLLYVLAVTVGAPFLLLSTTGPLLQRWFGATCHSRAQDPYFLFAAGNAGSLLALLSYPVVIEPRLALDRQLAYWSYGYVVFGVLIVMCVVALRRHAPHVTVASTVEVARGSRVLGRRRLRWVAIAALPSSFMLGTTTHLTTDLTPVPLLWVVPLALYLVTFIVPFALKRPVAGALATRLSVAVPLLLLTIVVTAGNLTLPILVQVGLHLALFTVVALVAHARLAEDRPEVEDLTMFYVLVALGGAVGGAFNGLVAPLLFNHFYEYPLALAAAALLLPGGGSSPGWVHRRYGRLGRVAVVVVFLVSALGLKVAGTVEKAPWASAAVAVAVLGLAVFALRRPLMLAASVALLMLLPLVMAPSLMTSRTFFGVHRVTASDDGRHVLSHGSTVHGWQDMRPGHRHEPQSYYHREGPAGQVLSAMAADAPARIGVVGLGTGGLAAWGRSGDHMTFFEIDEKIVEIAQNPDYFTYLTDSQAAVDVVVGDGRITLRNEPDGSYDVIVLDAFTSDAVPVHLTTREAVSMYLSKLKPDGVLLFHISNRHVDLAPVLANIAHAEGVGVVLQRYRSPRNGAATSSDWAVLSADRAAIDRLAVTDRWVRLVGDPSAPVWSDDFSNVLGALR